MTPATERPIHDACPDCGYALEGVPTAGCPECGVHTRLAGRRRHMTRYARWMRPALLAGTVAAPLFPPAVVLAVGAPTIVAGAVEWAIDRAAPAIWMVSVPIAMINLTLLGWAVVRPRALFWLGASTRDLLTAYVVLQAASLVGGLLLAIAAIALR